MEVIQNTLFRKTYQEPLVPTREKTSAQYLKSSSKSTSRQPLCLRFLKRDGATTTVSTETDGALLTELSINWWGTKSILWIH